MLIMEFSMGTSIIEDCKPFSVPSSERVFFSVGHPPDFRSTLLDRHVMYWTLQQQQRKESNIIGRKKGKNAAAAAIGHGEWERNPFHASRER